MHKELNDFEFLQREGYLDLHLIPGRHWCAIEQLFNTWGLWYGMDRHSKQGIYYFETYAAAFMALVEWDGLGDPPGPWIKHKQPGVGEWTNPKHPSYFKPD